MTGSGWAGGVTVARERVQHEHRVRRARVELPQVSNATFDRRETSAGLEHVRPVAEQRRELPAARRIAGAPGTSCRERVVVDPVGHPAPLAARNPASRSARMSSSVSIPTQRRTSPGVTPVVGLLVLGELRVCRRRGMDREAAHVTDVGEVAEKLEAVDELLARLETALDAEREDGALTVRQVLLRPRLPRARVRPGNATHCTSSRPSSHWATASAFSQ